MQELVDIFENAKQRIESIKQEILILSDEMREKKVKEKEGEKNKDDSSSKRIYSKLSIEPMTRLRKDVKEVKEAEENPEIQFVVDKLGDIFK